MKHDLCQMITICHHETLVSSLSIFSPPTFMDNTILIPLAERLRNEISEADMKYIYTDIKLKSEMQSDAICIHGNTGWILYLIVFLLELAKNPNRGHVHFDEFNWMDKESIELIIEKNNDQ